MNSTDKQKFSGLPPMTDYYVLPSHKALDEALEKKLIEILNLVNLDNPEKSTMLDYFIARIIIQLLIHDSINLRDFVHELQVDGPFEDPLDFDAACRIVLDWCKTGGKKAAKIGHPLN
jgi:hypothetical protein